MEILNFLLPIHLSPFKIDILPGVFFVIIWGLFIFTIVRVYQTAKPENWENNWYGGNKNNKSKKMDAEHGSVMEISEAVATPAEKLADIMPGMILIIGLLGTFLGLGLALDKASSILTGANALSNMDASMANLMQMLEGLGTKFKTSTWGLLAFILLKVILSKNGYEEHRLRWSIEKVKSELDIVREQDLLEQRTNNQKIIDSMQAIAISFERSIQKNQIQYNQKIQALIEYGAQTANSIQLNHQENKSFLNELVAQGKESKDAMVGFIEKNEATVSTLNKSAAGMSDAAIQMGQSAIHLQGVIDSFKTNMGEVISLMKDDLNSTIKGMNESFGNNMSEMSKGLGIATTDISNAVKSLSINVDKTMSDVTKTISDSMDLQIKSSTQFSVMSDSLIDQVEGMTGLVEKLGDNITHGLKSVSESNRYMINVAKKTEELANLVDTTFSESVEKIHSVTTLKPSLDNLVHGINSQIAILTQIETNTSVPEVVKKTNTILPKIGFGGK
ncbi:hypothetical protein ACNPQK_21680 [Acinetobacter guillouiae]|uniref:hypothetical protein n=1 Tax=Acinetobacter guillouiae TaxID=106649 RepID=UPI003AF93532